MGKKVTVLGGCGAVGSVASRTLADQEMFDTVVVADLRREMAERLVSELPEGKGKAAAFDAEDPASVRSVIAGSDVVLNCVGPFYKTVKTVLAAVLEEKIDYIDVCDDVDVTQEILDWDAKARDAGISAVIGMGSSPGATNLLGKFAADQLLDETEAIDIFHAHGGEPVEGAGVIGHRFHCMSIDIPMYLDGKLTYLKFFEPDGVALRQEFTFPVLDETVTLYPYPHPEQVTLPQYIPCRQVTNKGTVLPAPYYELTKEMCRLGFASRDPLEVAGQSVVPYDFAVAYILKERERILKETRFGSQRGCVSVIVRGKKNGKNREYRFHMASRSQALGEGTGLPAAGGTLLLARGKIDRKGVFPPEGGVNPLDFLEIIPSIMKLDEKKEGGESFGGVIVEEVDENGNVKKIDI